MAAERFRLTRIYTRTGDAGETGLVTGERVSKADLRIAAYGDVDELNSALGVARAMNRARPPQPPSSAPGRDAIDEWLRDVQNELFLVGSDLASVLSKRPAQMKVVGAAEATRLEQRIDSMNETLGPLTEFILPGGGMLGSQIHLARTICRRAERVAVALAQREPVDAATLAYLNRLSDFLFVLARFAAKQCGEPEELWRR
jgi:cob(I)alamin adenosyltransferase